MAKGSETIVGELLDAEKIAALRLATIEKDIAVNNEKIETQGADIEKQWGMISALSDIAKRNQTLLGIASTVLFLVVSGLITMWFTK